MSTPELRQYIEGELARGISKDDLRSHLITHGWPETDIDSALSGEQKLSAASVSKPGPSAVKMYNPNGYTIAGFLLGVIPVFIMSLSNSKHLPGGEKIRSAMKKFIIATVVIFAADIGVYVWAYTAIKQALMQAIAANPLEYMRFAIGSFGTENMVEQIMKTNPSISFAVAVVNNANVIFFLINVLVLILTIRFTNKHELPEYKQLKQEGLIVVKGPLVPVIIGIVFSIIVYSAFSQLPAILMH
jgi:hypothetical protein